MKTKMLFIKWVLILGLYDIQAQTGRDIFHMNYSYLPQVGLTQNKGKVGVQQFDIFGILPPIHFGQRIDFINAFYYRNTQLNYDETFQRQNIFPKRIHDIRYMPTFRVQMTPQWNLLLLPKILLRGDLEGPIRGKNLITQTGFIFSYNYTGDYTLKIGFGGGIGLFEFKHIRFWPLIQFNYHKRKVKCEIALPYANLTYNLTKDLEVGLFSMADNSISTVTPFPFENETATHFRIFQVVVAPTIAHRLYRNFFGHIKLGGLVPVRQLRPLDQDFHSIDILKFGPTSSLYFKIGFSYRR